MRELCNEAMKLRTEVEKWRKKNEIDIQSPIWYYEVVNEINGCPSTLHEDGIEYMLNGMKNEE